MPALRRRGAVGDLARQERVPRVHGGHAHRQGHRGDTGRRWALQSRHRRLSRTPDRAATRTRPGTTPLRCHDHGDTHIAGGQAENHRRDSTTRSAPGPPLGWMARSTPLGWPPLHSTRPSGTRAMTAAASGVPTGRTCATGRSRSVITRPLPSRTRARYWAKRSRPRGPRGRSSIQSLRTVCGSAPGRGAGPSARSAFGGGWSAGAHPGGRRGPTYSPPRDRRLRRGGRRRQRQEKGAMSACNCRRRSGIGSDRGLLQRRSRRPLACGRSPRPRFMRKSGVRSVVVGFRLGRPPRAGATGPGWAGGPNTFPGPGRHPG